MEVEWNEPKAEGIWYWDGEGWRGFWFPVLSPGARAELAHRVQAGGYVDRGLLEGGRPPVRVYPAI